jgi:TolB-like protein
MKDFKGFATVICRINMKVMNLKIISAIALGLMANSIANADTLLPITVAVYDFSDADKGADNYGSKVTAFVTANLTDETNLVMLERAELNKALQEQAFGTSGMVNPDAAAQIGQITGAKVLVAGQVIRTGDNHLIIVANIVGTETGRFFADKMEGSADDLARLASDLSRKIAQTIGDQAANLVAVTQESSAERLEQIIKNLTGTNRPSVSIKVKYLRPDYPEDSFTCEEEFGHILLKAGFPVVDENSDQKPDVEITGVAKFDPASRHGELFSSRGVLELKVQERRTGRIIAFDRQEGIAIDPGGKAANRKAQVIAVDDMAGRILQLLAQ